MDILYSVGLISVFIPLSLMPHCHVWMDHRTRISVHSLKYQDHIFFGCLSIISVNNYLSSILCIIKFLRGLMGFHAFLFGNMEKLLNRKPESVAPMTHYINQIFLELRTFKIFACG